MGSGWLAPRGVWLEGNRPAEHDGTGSFFLPPRLSGEKGPVTGSVNGGFRLCLLLSPTVRSLNIARRWVQPSRRQHNTRLAGTHPRQPVQQANGRSLLLKVTDPGPDSASLEQPTFVSGLHILLLPFCSQQRTCRPSLVL